MGFLRRLFGEPTPPPEIDHPLFGPIRYSRPDGWQNRAFVLWGQGDVELLLDAGPLGPTTRQEDEFVRFRDAGDALLARCLAAVDEARRGMAVSPGEFRISGLTIPSFETGPQPRLWTLWFDLEGDDHFMYGVQSDDEWRTLAAFADD